MMIWKTTLFGTLTAHVLLLAMMSSTQATDLALCSAEAAPAGIAVKQRLYLPDGSTKLLFISDSVSPSPDCDIVTLPRLASPLLWTSVVPSSDDSQASNLLILQGLFNDDSSAVSEVIRPGRVLEPTPVLYFTENILPKMQTRAFGIEERAQWIENTQLVCASGSQVAGAVFTAIAPWPHTDAYTIQISAHGRGDFDISIADQPRLNNENPYPLQRIALQSPDSEDESATLFSIEAPGNDESWRAITFTCPEAGGEIAFDSITLIPSAKPINHHRSAWVWSAQHWLEQPEKVWSLKDVESVDQIYITVPVLPNGDIAHPAQLSAFIQASHEREMTVWAVVGDPRDVLAENLPALLNRTQAYLHYNGTQNEQSRLDGLQLDIEPYLLPGQNIDTENWRERYVSTISAVHSAIAGALELDLVMPVWWGEHPDWGHKLLSQLVLPKLSVTVMNYRTNPTQLKAGALAFLDWGQRNAQAVRIAVETGELVNETRRYYAANMTQGELWQIELGDAQVMLLLENAQTGLPGKPYAFRNEQEFSANNLTFRGNQEHLNSVVNSMLQEWSSWTSFSGIALHGLDQVYFPQQDEQ